MPKISTRTSGKEKILVEKKKSSKEVAAPAVKKSKIITPDSEPNSLENFDLSAVYASKFDELEKEYNMTTGEINIPDKLSTGFLSADLLSSGGIMAGTCTQWSGEEMAGKSTQALELLGQALDSRIPMIAYHDTENAVSDIKYASVLIGRDAVDVFEGVSKQARLYRKSLLENFFNYSRAMMKAVPDKIYRSDRKQWFYVFDSTKDSRALMEQFGYRGEKSYDKELYRLTKRYWCPTDRRGLQGLIFCDSYAALVTAAIDEKDTGNGRAGDARAFSDSFKKIVGIMKEKAFALVGTHQVREKPEATFGHGGPTLYENGGHALRFYSSNRVRYLNRGVVAAKHAGYDFERAIAENGFPDGKTGGEKSWYGSEQDQYNYMIMKNVKNKLGIPKLETYTRVCFKDGAGNPHGHDKVFDTYMYLYKTGRIEKVREKGKKNAFKINLDETRGKVFNWFEFKGFIIANTDPKMRKIVTDSLGGDKIPDIRKPLFKEIRSKKAYTLIAKRKKKDDDNEEVDLEN